MDRRHDQRQLADIDVRVTDLENPLRSGTARLTDISRTGMGLLAPFALSNGDLVQIDVDDSTLFGIVAHGNQEGLAWRAGVELQRVLMGDSGVSVLLHSTLRRVLPQVPGVGTGNIRT